MRKMLRVVFAVALIAIIYQFFVTFLINKRYDNYSLITKKHTYTIKETYKRKNKKHMYSFLILDDYNNNFVYSYDGDLNRQSKVIKDIISYQKNNLYCLAPVFKNNTIQNIVCRYEDQLVGYTYLKQIGNPEVDKFINILSRTEYTVNTKYQELNSAITKHEKISYYNDIDKNLYFAVWNYDGVSIVNNNEAEYEYLLDKDSYENNYAIMVDKFYIVLNTDQGFNSFYILNLKDGGHALIEAEENLSGNMYFNGVYKKKVYLTDIGNQKQYVIDPTNEKITTLEKPKYYDGKSLQDISIGELTNTPKYFIKDVIPKELTDKYGDNIMYSNDNYYFVENGGVYQIVGDNYEESVLLFRFNDLKEVKVLNGNVYGISEDTIYMYNHNLGLKRVIQDRELIYNSKNKYGVYEK